MNYNKRIDKKLKTVQPKNEPRRILRAMIKSLSASCKKKEIDYARMGEDLLSLCERLSRNNCYHNDSGLNALNELKTKLEGIKKWEFIDYNKEVANSICHYLIHQVENEVGLERNS